MKLEPFQDQSEQKVIEELYAGNEKMGPLYDMFRNRIPIHDVESSSVKLLLEAAGV